jgi:SAM-dependent methyltransferase
MDEQFWDERYSTSELVWSDRPNLFLVRETEDLPPGSALDLGCGEGRNAIWLAERGWRTVAADFSSVGLEKGRVLAASRGVVVSFEQHDARTWRPEQRFDLVAVFYLQLPEEQRRAALENALGAVAPGGRLLVVAHDLDNLERGVGGPQSAELLYTVAEVVALAEAAGFAVETAEQARRMASTSEGERDAIDTVVRARRPVSEIGL